MQKAEDIGRQAYKVGATISGEERVSFAVSRVSHTYDVHVACNGDGPGDL